MINKSKIVKDAQKFVTKGQLDKAIAEYCKVTSAFPNDTNTHNTIGDLYLKVGNKDKAIYSFKAAADILNKDGFTLKAIALYKKVLNINPSQVDVLMQMGKLNAERGMLGNANDNYLAAIAYFTKHGKRDKTLDIYKILCGLNPKNVKLAQKLAELYMSEGMESEGLSKIIELAEMKANDGELQDARTFLDKAANKGSDRHDFKLASALVNLKDGRIPEAVTQLEGLKSLDPNDTKVLLLLKDAYVHSGRYEDAAATVLKLLEIEPDNAEYRKTLITIYIKSGDFSSAWEQYRYQVEVHVDKKQFNKAQKLVQEYLEYSPDSIEARQVLVDIYTSIGREDRVAELHMEMADIYARTGDSDKALNIYNKLIEQDPDNENYKTAIINLGQMEARPIVTEAAAEQTAPPEPFDSFVEETLEEPPAESITYETEDEGQTSVEDAEQELPAEEPVPGLTYDFGTDIDVTRTGGPEEHMAAEGGGSIYDLTEEVDELPTLDLDSGLPDDLPPLDFGADDSEDMLPGQDKDENIYDLSEEVETGIGDLGIFETETGADEDNTPSESGQIKIVSEAGSLDLSDLEAEASGAPEAGPVSEPDMEPPVSQAASNFEESLTEVDVYIKYGLYPKAIELLGSLEVTHQANPEIQTKFIEICKAQGDLDGFVEKSLQLAVLYKSRDMEDEAREVIERAAELSPDDERLRLYNEVGTGEHDFTVPMDESEDESLEELGQSHIISERFEETGFAPGSVGYLEEIAEADFYAKQGLFEEAKAIYRRLLASAPENDELRDKYNELMDLERESQTGQEEGQPPEEAPEEQSAFEQAEDYDAKPHVEPASSLDNQLDEAFREMDFGDEAPEEKHAREDSAAVFVEEPPAPAESEVPASVVEEEQTVEFDDEDFFDLAAELREEMGTDIIKPETRSGPLQDDNLDAVFQEFRKGVNDQLSSEDYETHYNLGIAYKEMGMIDEALSEFSEASKDPSRALDCASMLGLCHLEKGEYGKAIDYFNKGLAIKGRSNEEYFGLKYDMATAYELSGDPSSALEAISDIYKSDQDFRDVRKRYQRLEKSMETTPEKDSKVKKSRVSYL